MNENAAVGRTTGDLTLVIRIRQAPDVLEWMRTGWFLARQSLNVLRLDKELVLFPLLSGVACLLVTGTFVTGLVTTIPLPVIADYGPIHKNPLVYALLFCFYLVTYFIIVFFNTALVACALIRFQGGNPTLICGLRAASRRLPQIAGWAVVCATVGTILRFIEAQSQRVGRHLARLLGAAWTIATFFVVPVLVVEGAGPRDAFRRSVSLMRQTWGESLVAAFGTGLLTFLLCLPGMALILGGVALIRANEPDAAVAVLVGALFLLMIAWLVSSAVKAILLTALYLFAVDGDVPEQFDRTLIEHAFCSASD